MDQQLRRGDRVRITIECDVQDFNAWADGWTEIGFAGRRDNIVLPTYAQRERVNLVVTYEVLNKTDVLPT